MPEGASLANGQPYFDYKGSSDNPERLVTRNTPVQTTKGVKNVPMQHLIKPNVSKAGKVVVGILKVAPGVGTVLSLASLACELSDICTNPDTGLLEKKTPTPPQFKNKTSSWTTSLLGNNPYTDAQLFCDAYYQVYTFKNSYPGGFTAVVDGNGWARCYGYYQGSIYENPVSSPPTYTCDTGYFAVGEQCEATPETLADNYRPLTETDWADAEEDLSVPQAIPLTIAAGEPVAVDVPVLQPKDLVVERTSETVRDEFGTPTGTKETTRRVVIEPLPNPAPTTPNSPAKVTETTITTITNITNNTSNSTTTINELSPDEEPPPEEEDTAIEIDEVADEELQEQTIESNFDTQSFGSGSCPSNPTVSTSVGTFTLPFHHACTFASMIKGIVLLLSALTAAYIIIGANKNGTN